MRDDRLGFGPAVEESIGAFLTPAGFVLASSAPDSVRYESGDVTVDISYSHFSYEIDLVIFRNDDETGTVSLRDI